MQSFKIQVEFSNFICKVYIMVTCILRHKTFHLQLYMLR